MNRKLNEGQARTILERVRAGEPQNLLAAEFGVSAAAVSALVAGKTWPHLPRTETTHPVQRARKLTPAAVQDICERRLQGESRRTLAKCYGVTTQTIANIEKGKTWAHVARSKPARRKVWET